MDLIQLENGYILTSICFTGFFRTLNIRAFRIAKVGPMHIECTIQKSSQYTREEEELIISTFKKQAREECKITFRYVEKFETVASGKRKFFIANTKNLTDDLTN